MVSDVMKFINVDEVFCKDCNLKDTDDCNYCDVHSMPAADVVPVVRCEKCKHWNELGGQTHNNSPTPLRGNCVEWGAVTEHTDFCSYGERREVSE